MNQLAIDVVLLKQPFCRVIPRMNKKDKDVFCGEKYPDVAHIMQVTKLNAYIFLTSNTQLLVFVEVYLSFYQQELLRHLLEMRTHGGITQQSPLYEGGSNTWTNQSSPGHHKSGNV